MAILAVPTGAMPVIFGSFPGEPIVTAAQRQERLILIIGGVAFLVAGVLCALTAIRLRPRAPEGGTALIASDCFPLESEKPLSRRRPVGPCVSIRSH